MNRRNRSYKKRFCFFPLLFFVLGYFIVLLMVAPFANTITSTTNLFLFNSEIASKPLKNIFTSAPVSQQQFVKLSEIEFPQYGMKFGQLSISSASIQADLYFGDDSDELKNGVGLYNGSSIPGYGKTVLVAGHNHTYFHTLGQVQIGDQITIETNYGTFFYKVTNTQVKDATDGSAYDLSSKTENLVLYTCYPFDCLGLTPERYYVYADYLSGPQIDTQG